MNDEKKSYDQLREELATAGNKITVGGLYVHYKHPEKPYRIIGFVVWEEDDSVAVLYQPLQEPGVTFCRPFDVWLEVVKWEGKLIPRFSKVR